MERPTINPPTPHERDCEVEPEPVKACRWIKINGVLIEEYEHKGRFYCYVNEFPCLETFADAIKIVAEKTRGEK